MRNGSIKKRHLHDVPLGEADIDAGFWEELVVNTLYRGVTGGREPYENSSNPDNRWSIKGDFENDFESRK